MNPVEIIVRASRLCRSLGVHWEGRECKACLEISKGIESAVIVEREEGAQKLDAMAQARVGDIKQVEALQKEVKRLTRMVELKPDIHVRGPESNRENIDNFQRLWEACIGLAEKADFKAIFRYCHRLEDALKEAELKLQEIHRDLCSVNCNWQGTSCFHTQLCAGWLEKIGAVADARKPKNGGET